MKSFLITLSLCLTVGGYGRDYESSFWGGWDQYKFGFNMEKAYLRFPQSPQVSQTSTTLSATASERSVIYTFSGYYPPIFNVVPSVYFNQVLSGVQQAPYVLLTHTIYPYNGNWVLDYVMDDTARSVYVKSRSIVTPFNVYTLQCIFPYGATECYHYFLESFQLICKDDD